MKIIVWGGISSIHLKRWVQWLVEHDVDVLPMVSQSDKLMEYKIRVFKPDIIHAFFLVPWGIVADKLGFHPVVTTALGSDLLQPQRYEVVNKDVDKALEHTDLFFADSQDLLDAGIKRGAQVDKSHVVPFGVNTSIFEPGYTPLRNTFHKTPDTKVILSPRHISGLYNQPVIINAFAEVVKEFPDSILVIHNPGDEDLQYREELVAQIETLGLGDKVLNSENIQYVRMPQLYRAVDVVVSIPKSDSLAMSNLEAGACEVPVIATRNKANAELVVPAQLVDPNDPMEVAASIVIALRSPKSGMKVLLHQRREYIQEHYEQDVCMGKALELYRSLL